MIAGQVGAMALSRTLLPRLRLLLAMEFMLRDAHIWDRLASSVSAMRRLVFST